MARIAEINGPGLSRYGVTCRMLSAVRIFHDIMGPGLPGHQV